MTIYIMALESVPTRYTCQWYHGLPSLLTAEACKRGIKIDVINISGYNKSETVDFNIPDGSGAFLNFAATNLWKNNQTNKIVQKFIKNEIKNGDKFLFPDAWHPGVIQIKYMSELLDIEIEINSQWHAGSYDPQDFLGRKVQDKSWTSNFERSVFHASDQNYFATGYHYELFRHGLEIGGFEMENKSTISGQPHNILMEEMKQYENIEKEDLILFPHRIAPEKQIDIFKDLAESMPEYKWVVCQEEQLTKHEYHTMLGKSKMVFSANLQETLGISAMEAVLVGSFPFVPDRLSYKEMYEYKYPSFWTTNYDNYLRHKSKLIEHIKAIMQTEHDFTRQRKNLVENYLHCGPMIDKLFS